MGFAAGEGAGAAPAPAGDGGPAAGGGPDLHIHVHRDLGVGAGVAGVHGHAAGGGLAGDSYTRDIIKVVFRAKDSGVGAQGHTQGQDQGQGNDAYVFLHWDHTFLFCIRASYLALHYYNGSDLKKVTGFL